MVAPGTVSQPLSTAATRAMLLPDSPPGSPQPSSRSSIIGASRPGTCATAVAVMKAARSSGRQSLSDPLPARPIGVRAVATMTASGMGAGEAGDVGNVVHVRLRHHAGEHRGLAAGAHQLAEHPLVVHVLGRA